ncbi:MAG: hypothetical protein FWC70_02670 [Defluviitaleaceae bacterium]|nr:hypothetical protein [Defluviitaleaceae bacterium]
MQKHNDSIVAFYEDPSLYDALSAHEAALQALLAHPNSETYKAARETYSVAREAWDAANVAEQARYDAARELYDTAREAFEADKSAYTSAWSAWEDEMRTLTGQYNNLREEFEQMREQYLAEYDAYLAAREAHAAILARWEEWQQQRPESGEGIIREFVRLVGHNDAPATVAAWNGNQGDGSPVPGVFGVYVIGGGNRPLGLRITADAMQGTLTFSQRSGNQVRIYEIKIFEASEIIDIIAAQESTSALGFIGAEMLNIPTFTGTPPVPPTPPIAQFSPPPALETPTFDMSAPTFNLPPEPASPVFDEIPDYPINSAPPDDEPVISIPPDDDLDDEPVISIPPDDDLDDEPIISIPPDDDLDDEPVISIPPDDDLDDEPIISAPPITSPPRPGRPSPPAPLPSESPPATEHDDRNVLVGIFEMPEPDAPAATPAEIFDTPHVSAPDVLFARLENIDGDASTVIAPPTPFEMPQTGNAAHSLTTGLLLSAFAAAIIANRIRKNR